MKIKKIFNKINIKTDYYKEMVRIKLDVWYKNKFTPQERYLYYTTFKVSKYLITFFVILYFFLTFFMLLEFNTSPLKIGSLNIPVRVKVHYLLPTIEEKSTGSLLQNTDRDVNIMSESTLTKEQVISNAKYGYIIDKIWLLESTRGTAESGYHKDCESIGKTNEFGYGVYQGLCYNTFEESVYAVDEWLAEYIPKIGLNSTLCLYNTGKTIESCNYAKNYRNL